MSRRQSVPVAHRTGEQPESARRRNARPGAITQSGTLTASLTPVHWAILIGVLIICLVAISMPLRNYFTQRSEILRLESSISAQQLEKQRVSEEIAKFSDPAYRDEVARNRLGVTKPGEVAFRIDDPRITGAAPLATAQSVTDQPDTWYEQLWVSLGVQGVE